MKKLLDWLFAETVPAAALDAEREKRRVAERERAQCEQNYVRLLDMYQEKCAEVERLEKMQRFPRTFGVIVRGQA